MDDYGIKHWQSLIDRYHQLRDNLRPYERRGDSMLRMDTEVIE